MFAQLTLTPRTSFDQIGLHSSPEELLFYSIYLGVIIKLSLNPVVKGLALNYH